ncbi:MAG: ATP-binding protein [Candidatus Eisenbacteria bacterium]
MPTVRVSHKGQPAEPVTLDTGVYVIGRDPSSDVALDDKTVSRSHARLEVTSLGPTIAVVLEDLDSRNGTVVNGERIKRRELFAGDVVTIGSHTLTFDGLPVPAAGGNSATSGAVARAVHETMIVGSLDAQRVGRGEDVRDGQVSAEALTHRLALIYQIAEKLCGRLAVSEIADSFLGVLLDAFKGADRAVLLLEDQASCRLSPVAVKARDGSGGETGISQTVVETVLGERRSVLCRDTTSDQRFSTSQSLLDLRIWSIMCAPLLASDKIIGMVEVDSLQAASPFTEDDLRLLTGLAGQVAIAIENARLYGQIEQSKRLAAIGETVAGAAHCVKNVLNGIEGGLFIARKGLDAGSGEKAEKGWGMLERNSAFLKTMVLDMLDYSKEQVIELAETDLSSLLGEVVALVEGKAAEGGVSIAVDVDPELDRAVLDSKRIKRALVNIAGNAVEATSPTGSVRLSASPSGEGLFTISVSDTGSGIPEDAVQKIFEPFYSTKGSKGTGLGLPVARKIVEEHGGLLECDSVVGRGTTFRMTLPLRRPSS